MWESNQRAPIPYEEERELLKRYREAKRTRDKEAKEQ